MNDEKALRAEIRELKTLVLDLRTEVSALALAVRSKPDCGFVNRQGLVHMTEDPTAIDFDTLPDSLKKLAGR